MSDAKLKIIAGVFGLTIFGGVIVALVVALTADPKPAVPAAEPEPASEPVVVEPRKEIIGMSLEGRPIEAVTFGEGDIQLLFVGGIHGGYEWNSVLLAYTFIDHLHANPDSLPENLTVSVVPNANPDGLYDVIGVEGRFAPADVPIDEGPVGNGRFNARGVDLNRNFDCRWQPESTWRGNVVSAGTAPFSEPEAAALRDVVLRTEPKAVIFWHSQADAVYASECEEGVLPETIEVMNIYADAAGYRAVESFDAYPVTGDAEGWLASIGIPAITVELSTHETIEWEQNKRGVEALFAHYRNTPVAP